MNAKETGAAGEESARRFLLKKGFKIIAQNYAVPGGELDLVAQDGNTLAFIEVKTRASNGFGGPAAAITPAKQKRITLAAVCYIKEKRPKFDSIRFDAVCILAEDVQYIPNAFTPKRMNI